MLRLADVFVPQLGDPSGSLDGFNCTCASAAMTVRWHFRNVRPTPDPELVWPPMGGDVRRLTRDVEGGVLGPDTDGGTNLLQVAAAVLRGWGVDMDVYTNRDFDEGWDAMRDPDNVVIWQLQYSVLQGTPLAASRTFRGAHAGAGARASELAFDWGDPLADGRYDGCPKGTQTMTKTTLRNAAGQLVVDPDTGQRRGIGRANFAVVRAIELPEAPSTLDSGDLMFNVGPLSTYRDAVLKGGAVLYRDAALTVRHSAVSRRTPLAFLGSTRTAHVVVNAGNTNYVHRADVERIVVNERGFE